jgi:hypothetical protein
MFEFFFRAFSITTYNYNVMYNEEGSFGSKSPVNY